MISISLPLTLWRWPCVKRFLGQVSSSSSPLYRELFLRYKLVPAKIHPNAQRVIINFLINCSKVRLKPHIRAFKPVVVLKSGPRYISIVYASDRSQTLSLLVSNSLHKWSDSFFFICPEIGLWAFSLVQRQKLSLGSFHHQPQLLEVDYKLVQHIMKPLKLI